MSASARRGRRPRASSSGDAADGGLSRDRSADPRDDSDPGVNSGIDSDADRDRGPEADPESVARTIVLRQLTMTAKTRAELATTLAKRDVPADVATKVLDRMTEVGLVDDAAYAQEWVRQRQAGKGLSRRALANELRRKGVDDELADLALGQVSDEAERGMAFDLAVRKARTSRGHADDVRLRRLASMLARKGYSSSIAYAAARDALTADGIEFDD